MSMQDRLTELSLERGRIRNEMFSLLKDRSVDLEDRWDALMMIKDFNNFEIDMIFDEDEVIIIDGWVDL